MDAMEILTGESNRFESGQNLRPIEFKAIRDCLITIYERIAKLEARMTPANREIHGIEPKKETGEQLVSSDSVKTKRSKKNA